MNPHVSCFLAGVPRPGTLGSGLFRLGLVVLVCCLAVGRLAAEPPPKADLVVLNARVYTVNRAQPWAEALAIRGDRIVAVGSNAEMARWRSPRTRVLDAGGRLVLPGFTDSHVHFMMGSLALQRLNLEGARTVAEIQQRVKEYAAQHPARDADSAWIQGWGWSYGALPGNLPDKKYLDEVVPDRPVFLQGFDGHSSWANSKALELAGITRATPDPPTGEIVRDARGEPTGALKEFASMLVIKVAPPPTRAQKLETLRAGMAALNRAGLVRVHSCGFDFEHLDLLDELRRQDQLTLRFYVSYFVQPPQLRPQDLEQIEAARRRYHDDWISGGVVKLMLDGVIESHTAALFSPYSDDPTQSGKLFWEPEAYQQAVTELDRRGLQLFTHAVGDRSVRLALDAYQEAARANHTRDMRPRVEHVETITAADIPRFGALGVVASFQPLHAYPNEEALGVWKGHAGPERASRAWMWGSVAGAGGHLTFGSDWPVVTFDPWQGLQEAVTRQTFEGTPADGFLPGQRLSLAQAVEAYTLGAAYAARREKSEGSLEPGKLADLVVVSQNIFEVELRHIHETRVVLTVVGGKVVYQAPEWAGTAKPGY